MEVTELNIQLGSQLFITFRIVLKKPVKDPSDTEHIYLALLDTTMEMDILNGHLLILVDIQTQCTTPFQTIRNKSSM